MNRHYSFEEIYEQNRKRIHYHLHKLNIHDPHQEFFQEGLIALWNAHQTYQPDKGPMSTYFNYTIKYRLIDHIRKHQREHQHYSDTYQDLQDESHHMSSEPPHRDLPASLLQESAIQELKHHLTHNQWTWLHCTIEGHSTSEIAFLHQTTIDAVNSWRRGARRKLQMAEKESIVREILA
ncbi:DNA-directed RNA polymerase [Lentibacillus sp. JNUCC-1]|uniref:RNA polymerase sigma factor n=1 Tax=Lentibacillus sp. JNUCC-1 TaxID=2654513 RepID=UPI0012E7CEFC|nr:sigma-70 family RNA polymerase sigma factor [Lentibacillus sp. JNUCC-1]MUV38776.1 DNA-directed RNA polymerase [Lentibacillus sp. JNUCC-1]